MIQSKKVEKQAESKKDCKWFSKKAILWTRMLGRQPYSFCF